MQDKLKNAFGIDFIAAAQKALEDRAGLRLVPIAVEQPGPTYEEAKKGLQFSPLMLGAVLLLILLLRR